MESTDPIWTPEAAAAALAFCREFEGTPHRQRRLAAGRGADCVRFTVGVIQAAGILPAFQWPSYAQSYGYGMDVNWLAAEFLRTTFSHSIPVEGWEPQTGDIGIFKVGRVSNHTGIVVDGRFWHVTVGRAVHDCNIDAVRALLQEVIRIDSPGLRATPENRNS